MKRIFIVIASCIVYPSTPVKADTYIVAHMPVTLTTLQIKSIVKYYKNIGYTHIKTFYRGKDGTTLKGSPKEGQDVDLVIDMEINKETAEQFRNGKEL